MNSIAFQVARGLRMLFIKKSGFRLDKAEAE